LLLLGHHVVDRALVLSPEVEALGLESRSPGQPVLDQLGERRLRLGQTERRQGVLVAAEHFRVALVVLDSMRLEKFINFETYLQ